MILEIPLLIVWTYLSIALTLFFYTLKKNDKEVEKLKKATTLRDEKIGRILYQVNGIKFLLTKGYDTPKPKNTNPK